MTSVYAPQVWAIFREGVLVDAIESEELPAVTEGAKAYRVGPVPDFTSARRPRMAGILYRMGLLGQLDEALGLCRSGRCSYRAFWVWYGKGKKDAQGVTRGRVID